ncbi:hypothetical protein F2Q70_00019465 [Brassica cretica]|uniref:Uncharacterized protein n=1 Tax=Brassica cretica TaxID=69181 RepID=A0A8S9GKX2_BRACR|nr:hypothetical protein F2Q70_00019465 [Brassica cretica]
MLMHSTVNYDSLALDFMPVVGKSVMRVIADVAAVEAGLSPSDVSNVKSAPALARSSICRRILREGGEEMGLSAAPRRSNVDDTLLLMNYALCYISYSSLLLMYDICAF